MELQDWTGKQVGVFNILSYEGMHKGLSRWLCKCSLCGTEKIFTKKQIKVNKSCGCKSYEYRSGKLPSARGFVSLHPLYQTWHKMRRRCEDPKDDHYVEYGAKGIKVCTEWAEDPWSFYDYVSGELGEKPGELHTIDRIDGKGNYEPGNIRWASPALQAENRATTKWVEYQGKSYSFKQLEKITGTKADTLYARHRRKGADFLNSREKASLDGGGE